jgi:hypothetical protein
MSDARAIELVEQISDSMATLLVSCEVDEQDVHDAVTRSFRKVQALKREPVEATRYSLAHRDLFGRMLTLWRSPDYTDKDAKPLALPAIGPKPSMATLLELAAKGDTKILADLDPMAVADILVTHKSAAVNSDGLYYPTGYSFNFYTDGRASALLNLAYFAEFGTTNTYNAVNRGGRFNRVARVQALPASQVPLVKRWLRKQGRDFLLRIDAYMESLKVKSSDQDDLRDVGVGLYYLEQPHPEDK